MADILDERGTFSRRDIKLLLRASKMLLLRFGTLLGHAGQATREHRFGDAGHRNRQRQRGLHGPRAGALHTCTIDDHVHQRLAGLGIHLMQHFGGDLNQIRVQFGLVPLLEHVTDFGGIHAEPAVHEIVAFRDKLHIRVFDAVVDHLDEVPGAVLTDMRDARLTFGDRSDGLEDRAEGLPGFLSAAGHEGRAVERAFLASGHAAADEMQAARADVLLAANSVLEVRVAAVDDDVARLHGVGELVDHRVGRGAGLDHDDRGARALERGDELLNSFRGHEFAFGAVLVDELFRTLVMPVIHGYGVPVMRQVAGEVGAHCRQSDDADVCSSFYGHYVTFPKSK